MKYILLHYLGQRCILDKLESKMNTCVLDKSRVEKRNFVAKELIEPQLYKMQKQILLFAHLWEKQHIKYLL
jgi:hypothetical protein